MRLSEWDYDKGISLLGNIQHYFIDNMESEENGSK